MKKFIKTFIFAICLILPAMFCLTACDNKSCVHTFGEWTISTNATCIVDGEQYRECTECGHKETQSISATGHTFGGYIIDEIPTTQNSGEYHRECETCHEIDKVTVSALKSTGLEFELNEDKQSYAVTGIGSCTDTYLNIPNTHNGLPVTAIEFCAFEGNTNIVGITLSDYATLIASRAFYNCSNLKTINFTDNLEKVNGALVFDGCDLLEYNVYENAKYLGTKDNPYYVCVEVIDRTKTNCKVHNDTKIICYGAFYSVGKMESFTLSSNVKFISSALVMDMPGETSPINIYFCGTITDWCNIEIVGGFPLCKNGYNLYLNGEQVTDITIPGSVTKIRDYIFYNCKLSNKVTIEEGVQIIGKYSFFGTEVEEITLPDSVEEVGIGAFAGCKMKEIKLSKNTTKVGAVAFDYCSELEKITFYNTLEKIEDMIYGCSALTEIHFVGTIDEFQALDKDGQWNANCGEYTIYCTDGTIAKDGTVTRN